MRKFIPLFSPLQLFQEELEYFVIVCDYVRAKFFVVYLYMYCKCISMHTYVNINYVHIHKNKYAFT